MPGPGVENGILLHETSGGVVGLAFPALDARAHRGRMDRSDVLGDGAGWEHGTTTSKDSVYILSVCRRDEIRQAIIEKKKVLDEQESISYALIMRQTLSSSLYLSFGLSSLWGPEGSV